MLELERKKKIQLALMLWTSVRHYQVRYEESYQEMITNLTKMHRNANKLWHAHTFFFTFSWDLTHPSIMFIPPMIVIK